MSLIQRFSNLEFEHWDALCDAIASLIDNRTYRRFVRIHSHGNHRMHSWSRPAGPGRFLPWHRAYLIDFEWELRQINPVLSIPYWDWNDDDGRLINFPNPEDPRFSRGPWRRHLGTRRSEDSVEGRVPWSPNLEEHLQNILSSDSYYSFTQDLEGSLHNWGHNWIGGDMSDTMVSPKDPAFWFHHAQVDHIWALWQARPENQGRRADLLGDEANLDPWENDFTVENVNDISNLTSTRGNHSYEYIESTDT
jgi:tyrosinase